MNIETRVSTLLDYNSLTRWPATTWLIVPTTSQIATRRWPLQDGCYKMAATRWPLQDSQYKQGVRIEGVATPVSTLGASCYSDSSLSILFFVWLTLKRTALCDLKNICPIMQQVVILRAITLRSWLSELIFIATSIETLVNWLSVSKTESANKYTPTACKN